MTPCHLSALVHYRVVLPSVQYACPRHDHRGFPDLIGSPGFPVTRSEAGETLYRGQLRGPRMDPRAVCSVSLLLRYTCVALTAACVIVTQGIM